MRTRARNCLLDASQACGHVLDFVAGKQFADYLDDIQLRSAVERQLEIAGEAIAQALRLSPELQADIPEARDIVGFRNRLAHQYGSIMHDVVWNIVETELSELRAELIALLATPEDTDTE